MWIYHHYTSIHHCTAVSSSSDDIHRKHSSITARSITTVMCWYSWTGSIHHYTAVSSSSDDNHRKNSSIVAQQFISVMCWYSRTGSNHYCTAVSSSSDDIHWKHSSITTQQYHLSNVLIFMNRIHPPLHSCLLIQWW
jgi:hypothetical protein